MRDNSNYVHFRVGVLDQGACLLLLVLLVCLCMQARRRKHGLTAVLVSSIILALALGLGLGLGLKPAQTSRLQSQDDTQSAAVQTLAVHHVT